MAKKITLKTRNIKPSQDFLSKNTISYINDCLKDNREKDLPATPIVMKLNDDYIAIDGHNLINVFDELGRDIEVFVVSGPKDLPSELKDTSRAQILETKYDYIPRMIEEIRKKHIDSFATLRKNGTLL